MRADVWWTDFGPPVDSEQASGRRPGVVISSDDLHATRAPLAFVVPVTSRRRPYPSRVPIAPGRSGLQVASWAAVEHTKSISTLRLLERLGSVSEDVIGEILGSLRWLLDLDP